VAIVKAGPPGDMVIGFPTPYQYKVNIANAGPNNAQDVVIRDLVPAQFVKIDSARLFIADDWRARLEWLATLRERADIVVTRLERKLDGALPEGVHLQGHAYGLPAQRAAIMRAERHVLDRFAF